MFQFLTAILVCYTVFTHNNVLAIIDGDSTTIEDHPYHIAVESNKQYRGGGALITTKEVLTTARVVTSEQPYQVLAGSTYRCSNETGERRDVIYKKIHAQYNPSTRDYNVAILTLDREFPWTSSIQPISLQGFDKDVPNYKWAVVTGWQSPKCNDLKSLPLEKVPDDIVRRFKVTERMHVFSNNGKNGRPESDGGCPLVYSSKLAGLDIYQVFQDSVAYTVYLKIADPEIFKFIASNSGYSTKI